MTKILILLMSTISFFTFASTSTSESLQKQLIEVVKRDWPLASSIEVKNFKLHKPAPKTAVLLSLRPRPLIGAVSFEVAWEKKGSSHKTFGSAIVMVRHPIATATRDIRRGEDISQDNMMWVPQDISRFSSQSVLTDPSELTGKIARAFIRSGSKIQTSQLETPAEINRGQRVDLVFENPQLKVTARMKALESGRTGEWIRVENEKTKRVVRSKVVGPGKVSLN